MRRLIHASLLVVLLCAGGLRPESGNGSAAAALPDGSLAMYGVVDAFEAPDLARQSGARWQRIAFFWNSIQPDSAEQWLPNHYSTDADVAAAVRDGVAPVGLIGNPPAWATRNGSVPKNLNRGIDDPANYWAQFVGRLVAQHKGQIDDWIIWNEPDIDPRFPGSTWAGSEEEYYLLLKSAALAAKKANPKARIIFAGTTYWFDVNQNNKQFFERVLEVAKTDPTAAAHGYYFDAVDVHLYSSPDHIPVVAKAFREILGRFNLSKPLWMTELNVVPANDPAAIVPRGGFRASLDEQASYVIQALAQARASGVERASIYKMKDGAIINGEPYGLARNDLSTRPAFSAFKTAAQYLSLPGTVTSERQGNVEIVTIDGGDRRVTVLWALEPKNETTEVVVGGSRAKLISQDGTTVDLPSPLTSGRTSYSIALPGATCNTDDARPNHYIIGGAPYILYEEGAGEEVALSATESFFPRTSFAASSSFLDFYHHRGGAKTFGFPVSRPFRLEGRVVQFYQRHVMELRADGTVGLLNILDEGYMPYTHINGATVPGIDTVLTKTAPVPGAAGYGAKIVDFVRATAVDSWSGLAVGFGSTFASTVTLSDAFGAQPASAALLPGLNLEIWGAPTSRPARDPLNDDFVYQRFQRGIMHFDRVTGKTQGLLLADYLKAIVVGRGLPADLEQQARGSRFYQQYDPTKAHSVADPTRLKDSDLTNAFEPGR